MGFGVITGLLGAVPPGFGLGPFSFGGGGAVHGLPVGPFVLVTSYLEAAI